jgi:DNA helicase-2/ATP-dependent DNA helicase PcrA
MNLARDLNPSQLEAVEYAGGPMLVVAGAGSGKTRVITFKVATLIDSGRFQSEQILAVTFTNKAAEEMKARIHSLLEGRVSRMPLICTFHSFCARFLRREIEVLGWPRDYTIYDSDDQLRLVKNILKALRVNDKEITPELVLYRIGHAKIHAIGPDEYARRFFRPEDETVATAYRQYERHLRQNGALDFDDLILKSNEIMRRFPEVREAVGRQFRYLLVDEFQDSNPPQYELVRHLTATHRNLCVVGDEDQSIYGFRGAVMANILNFERDFPGARVFKLEQNYRSTPAILRAASALVAHNLNRREKTLWTANQEGPPVVLYQAADAPEEAGWVARAIKDVLLDDFHATIGVLYRANFQSRRMEDALKRQGIAYRIVGGLSFYGRREIKDIVAYLKLLQNRQDEVALLRVINTPPRGIGDKTVDFVVQQARRQEKPIWDCLGEEAEGENLQTRGRSSLAQFRDMILRLERLVGQEPLDALLERVFALSGYKQFLETSAEPDAETRRENIQELIQLAAEHQREGGNLGTFLDRVALVNEGDTVQGSGRVSLMTLHGAKGLEFDFVFLVGLEQGLLPHRRSLQKEDDIEEERRLCYVGMTRARRRLALSLARTRARFDGALAEPSEPSVFLREIPEESLLPLKPYAPFPLRPERIESRPRPKEKLKTQGFATLDTAAEVRSFFRQRSEAHPAAAGATAPKIVHRPATVPPKSPPAKQGQPASAAGRKTGGGGAADSGWKPGQAVRHDKFGSGTILKVERSKLGIKLTITFEKRGLRQLLAHLAQLEKLG